MRQPSIHITREVFIELLRKFVDDISPTTVDEFFRLARGYSLDNRSMLVSTSKYKKISKHVEGSIGDANLAADIIYSLRIKLHHLGVTKIKQTDPAWGQIRQLTPTLNQFCESHNFSKREGYITFIDLGLKLMAKNKRPNYGYTASWILNHAQFIEENYDSIELVKNDQYSIQTELLMNYYKTKVLEITGISIDYKKNPQDYICFVKARELCDRLSVDYEVFIEAQFDALAFCNGIPNLSDLSNEKAEQRLAKYISKTGITIKPKSNLSESDWDTFKK